MYHFAGVGTVTAYASAAELPHAGAIWLIGRLLLDGAGTLFGLYLVVFVGLLLFGHLLRYRERNVVG